MVTVIDFLSVTVEIRLIVRQNCQKHLFDILVNIFSFNIRLGEQLSQTIQAFSKKLIQ